MTGAPLALLVGFDRSGSSMIARVLAGHPEVELLFQPFNSTEVHRAQWRAWPPDEPHPATEAFLGGLLRGALDRGYLESDWFDSHSTTDRIHPGKLHLVKDTKLHFQIRWLAARFPELPVYGIWRDPRAIVCSLLRNDFHRRWYGDVGAARLREVIERVEGLQPYAPLLAGDLGEHERTALLVALRSHRLVADLPPDRWLVYEEVLDDPSRTLRELTAAFSLGRHDFRPGVQEDQNVIGATFCGRDLWKRFFSRDEIADLDRIFRPLEAAWDARRAVLR